MNAIPPFIAGIAGRLRAAATDAEHVQRQRRSHPTRRADGRTPNPRAADSALAAALNAPVEAMELFAPRKSSRRT